jgi:hypothetical protein
VGKGLTRKFKRKEKREGQLSLEKRKSKLFDWLKIEALILTR